MSAPSTPFIPLRVSRHFAAPCERVFDAWLDAGGAGAWLFATPTGEMAQVEMDPRVGGRWRIVERRPEGDALHTGTYVTIDRPRRLAFTFASDETSEGDRVSVDVADLEPGCELTLVHAMSAERADYADRTEEGWRDILDGLATALGEGGAPVTPPPT
jgi:uncharacterized protein YndB with AHSA1/START domain